MAYLEQSTRYVPYTDRPDGRWKYHVPAEIARTPLAAAYTGTLDFAFEIYARWIPAMEAHFRAKYPKSARRLRRGVSVGHPREGARHAARPAAGGDDVERRACSAPARPTRRCCCGCSRTRSRRSAPRADQMLAELRQVMPAFLARVDQPDARRAMEPVPRRDPQATSKRPRVPASTGSTPEPRERGDPHRVRPRRRDQGGGGGALQPSSNLPDDQLLAIARAMTRRRSRGGPAGLHRRARQPAPQAGARVRAHALPVRRPRRLRRVPRPAAPPAAHARVAAAHHPITGTSSRPPSRRPAPSTTGAR